MDTLYEKKHYLPLYEAKMMHQFDHRFSHSEPPMVGQRIRGRSVSIADEQHADPCYYALPRYWVTASEVDTRYPSMRWCMVFRDVTGAVL